MSADILLYSQNVFTAKTLTPAPLYVAVKGGLIADVGPIEEKDKWIDENTKVYDLGERVISPGFTDTHSFFTGYEFGFLGADLTGVKHPLKKIVFGHGVDWANVGGKNPGPEILDQVISDRPVIIVHASRRQAWLNTMALDFYRIDPEHVFAEGNWRAMNAYLSDEEFMVDDFVE